MKDLIAKLQIDANCALGAIWMHIDAQAARIAELEAQIAAASAPVVEQQPIGYTCQYDLDCLANYNNVTIFPEFDKDISPIALYTAPKAADTDKLREAIYQFQHRDSPIIWTDVDAYVYETQIAGGDQSRVRKVFLADQMALQAPVREVPVGWIAISERLPDDRQLVWCTRNDGRVHLARRHGDKPLATGEPWQDCYWWDQETGSNWSDVTVSAWTPVPERVRPLPAAPVQEQKP